MKKFISILLLCPLLIVGCRQRQVIPDNELAQIFRDAFVVNAYTAERKVKLDSLNIYEPIFESYGYTVEDVQYTIGNFSKRKSARLGDVVEEAIVILESEGMEFAREVAILDTVRAISQRRMQSTMLKRDSILVTSLSDSSTLRLHISPARVGDYDKSFDYLIDSLDENVGAYRTLAWFSNRDNELVSKSPDRKKRLHESVSYIQRAKVLTHTKKLEANEEYRYLTVELVNFLGKKRAPHIKIRNLQVVYTPPAEVAEDMLFEKMVNLNIFSDELLVPATDSL